MKTIKLSLLALSALLMNVVANAQSTNTQGVCYTDEFFNERAANDPSLLQKRQEMENYIATFKETYDPSAQKPATIIIPVVVHNITHDGGVGYVSKATIDAQIARLNTDYNALNTDLSLVRSEFVPYIAAIDIEFRLAHIDPNGNCTEGIVRKESPYSYNTQVNNNVKAVSYWDSKKYLNIWVIDEIQDNNDGSYVAGFAQFAGSGINNTYGVVVVNQNFSGSDRTLTHEVGHCLNLYHTFQGNCGSSCGSSGDYVCDTPPTSNGGFDCNVTSTCSNDGSGSSPFSSNMNDQFENYMSYSQCTHMFTLGQQTRMMAVLNSTSTSTGLAQLSTSANLTATGVADPYGPVICKPTADFTYNKEYICEGGNVTYTDQSWGSAATAWSWTFTGGTPNTGNTANPTITYNNAGVYGATLVASNSASGSGTKTINNIITVSSLTADYAGAVIDGFENTTQYNADWRIESNEGQTWQNLSIAAATGSRSVRLRNTATSNTGEVDELISPSYDISSLTSPVMDFKIAFKRKASNNSDKLFVYYSTNCGASWSFTNVLLGASAMSTSPDQTSEFTPTSASHWIAKSADLSSISNNTNVRFKFAFTSGGGNNIFIDDINIHGAVGINELDKIGHFNIFPNPTNSSAQISFNLVKTVDNLSIKLRNAVGQEVTRVINNQSFTAGQYTLKVDKERKLSKGIYFIEFIADGIAQTQKLIVQ